MPTNTNITKTNAGQEYCQLADDVQAVANHQDEQAYSRVFEHFFPLIQSYIWSKHPGASAVVNDITQDVMIKVWQKAHTYNVDLSSVSTWIYTMARNTRIDYYRKNSKHESHVDPQLLWENVVDNACGPFEATLRRHAEKQIHQQISQLPQEQQHVVHKLYMEGKTHKQVATDLKIPLGTVKSRIRLALRKLAIMRNWHEK